MSPFVANSYAKHVSFVSILLIASIPVFTEYSDSAQHSVVACEPLAQHQSRNLDAVLKLFHSFLNWSNRTHRLIER